VQVFFGFAQQMQQRLVGDWSSRVITRLASNTPAVGGGSLNTDRTRARTFTRAAPLPCAWRIEHVSGARGG
jgi:hypothetical protein